MSTTKIQLHIHRHQEREHPSIEDTVTLEAVATLPDGRTGTAHLARQHPPGVYYTPEDVSDAILDAMQRAGGTLYTVGGRNLSRTPPLGEGKESSSTTSAQRLNLKQF